MGTFITKHPNEEALSRINAFRKSGKFCDVTLIVEGVEFPAHKTMLAGFSTYFESMFSGDFAEAKQESIKFESVELSVMESLLEFAYTGCLELTSENVQALLHAANFLQTKELFEQCCAYMESNLSTENCVGIYNMSEIYSCKEMNNKAKQFILKNFSDVCVEVDFLELGAEKLIDLIDDGGLRVEKEERVFDAVLQWYHYKQEERESFLPEVIRHVRLTDLDPYFLHTRLKTTDALMKSESCMKLFLDVFSYRFLPNRRNEIQSYFSKQRDSAPSPYVEVLVVTGNCESNRSTKHLCVTEEGQVMRSFVFPYGGDLQVSKSTVSTTSAYGLFCVSSVGGIHYFDYQIDDWSTYEDTWNVPLDKAVYNFDGRWYSFGRLESDRAVELLDDAVDDQFDRTWGPVAPMLESVCNPGVVSVDGIIYLVGGNTKDRTPSRRIQSYDPFNKTWSLVSSLPAPWKSLKVCALHGQIYVFSDNCPDDSEYEKWQLDVYNVSSNQWKACSKIPQKFENHSILKTVAFHGNIHVLVEKGDNHDIQVYSPTSDSWHDFPTIAHDDFDIRTIRGPMLIKRPCVNDLNHL